MKLILFRINIVADGADNVVTVDVESFKDVNF